MGRTRVHSLASRIVLGCARPRINCVFFFDGSPFINEIYRRVNISKRTHSSFKLLMRVRDQMPRLQLNPRALMKGQVERENAKKGISVRDIYMLEVEKD